MSATSCLNCTAPKPRPWVSHGWCRITVIGASRGISGWVCSTPCLQAVGAKIVAVAANNLNATTQGTVTGVT